MDTVKSEETSALSSEAVVLAKKYASLQASKKELEAQKKDIEAEMDMVGTTLRDKMIELEMQNFKLEGVGTLYLQTSFYPKVVDREKLIAWLDARELSGTAPRTVHLPSLREIYQERAENDKDLPSQDMVEAHSVTDVRLRASK